MTRGTVVVAMSGGVDSSATAALLKELGYDVVGFSMQLYDQRRSGPAQDILQPGRCCALEDLYDARRVASCLGIPHYVVSLEREFETLVMDSFAEDYRNGLTPSPCVRCNSIMKFDRLVKLADDIGAHFVATGHYARVAKDEATGRYLLRKGIDSGRDQSYFLFELRQDQLARAMFPLGALEKSEVRLIARKYGLDVADKADSQEICFIPDGDYAAFVERYLREKGRGPESLVGHFVDVEGAVIKPHRGIHRYTIGQRRGLGIAHATPLYVIDIQPDGRRVVVGERHLLARRSFRAVRSNWIAFPEPAQPFRAAVKIRSRHAEALATITPCAGGAIRVDFDEAQMAVTPGQAAVLYQGDRVVGGAWIARGDADDSDGQTQD